MERASTLDGIARKPSGLGPTAAPGLRYPGLSWPAAEQRLLLRALFAPPEIALPSFRAWRDPLDLDTLDSGSLSLMPLLSLRLRTLGVDDTIVPRLKGAHHYHWTRNQIRLRQCFDGIDALQARGCRIVALKGLAVLPQYDDMGLRPMSDVDLLLPRDSATLAIDTLIERGWVLNHGKPRAEVGAALQARHGLGLNKRGSELDIHWSSLVEDLSKGADAGLWARARRHSFWGRELLVPCFEDLLLHTCVHGARFSRAMSVTWVPDIVRLVEQHGAELDWALIVSEARRRVLEIPLQETLRFLKEELSCAIPGHVLEALEPREPGWLFWLDHHVYAADPEASTSVHRAAARIVARLRRGESLPSGLVPPTFRSVSVGN